MGNFGEEIQFLFCLEKMEEDKIYKTIKILKNLLNNQEIKKEKKSHLHILIETSLLNYLKEEADKDGVSLTHLCKRKLGRS